MLANNEIPITCINSEEETDLTSILNTICKSYSSGNMFIHKIFIDQKLNKNIRKNDFLNVNEFEIKSSGNILIIDKKTIKRITKLDKIKNKKMLLI